MVYMDTLSNFNTVLVGHARICIFSVRKCKLGITTVLTNLIIIRCCMPQKSTHRHSSFLWKWSSKITNFFTNICCVTLFTFFYKQHYSATKKKPCLCAWKSNRGITKFWNQLSLQDVDKTSIQSWKAVFSMQNSVNDKEVMTTKENFGFDGLKI